MSTTDTDAQRAPVPPGWPGDDPTLPDDLDALGARWWWWVGRRTRGRRVGALEGPGSRSSDADRTGERAAEGDGDDWPADDVAVADDELDLDDDPGGAGPRWTDRFRWRGSPPEDREPPDDDEPLPVDDDDLVAGVQPAGRVLVVLVATLVLALLVNVDDLVARVEAQPPGPARDRTLAVLHPVQDVGNALQLTRIRDALDALSGDGGDGPAATGRDGARRQDGDRAAPRGDGGDEPAGDGEGEEGTERDDGPRAPTPDDPLRVWVGGDFMAQAIGRSLAAAGDATGVVETEVRYEAASGLTRRDYFDWPAAVEEALDEHDPEVVVLVLGVNDAQGIVRPDGTPAQVDEPGWADEYGRRVGELMDRLGGDGRLVVWIGPPPMREPGYSARMAAITAIYAEQAATRPWVHVVDLARVVGGPDGAYADAVADPASGAPVTVRQPDGIHLTDTGSDLVAAHVMDLLRTRVDLSGAAGGDG